MFSGKTHFTMFDCLFGFLFVPLEIFSLIARRHHHRWRAPDFDLCSMAIGSFCFFSVSQLLWHWASLYNGHLRGPVTLKLLSSVWQWSYHYLFLRLWSGSAGIRNPTFPLQGERSNPLRHGYGHITMYNSTTAI